MGKNEPSQHMTKMFPPQISNFETNTGSIAKLKYASESYNFQLLDESLNVKNAHIMGKNESLQHMTKMFPPPSPISDYGANTGSIAKLKYASESYKFQLLDKPLNVKNAQIIGKNELLQHMIKMFPPQISNFRTNTGLIAKLKYASKRYKF
jgi:hypothetical protein